MNHFSVYERLSSCEFLLCVILLLDMTNYHICIKLPFITMWPTYIGYETSKAVTHQTLLHVITMKLHPPHPSPLHPPTPHPTSSTSFSASTYSSSSSLLDRLMNITYKNQSNSPFLCMSHRDCAIFSASAYIRLSIPSYPPIIKSHIEHREPELR